MKLSISSNDKVILVPTTLVGPKQSHNINLILDTGASFTMISPEILVRIGLDPAEALHKSTIATASGVEFVAFVKLPRLEVLGVKRSDIEICVHSLPATVPARGLLGLNFLRHFDVHLNLPQGYLEII